MDMSAVVSTSALIKTSVKDIVNVLTKCSQLSSSIFTLHIDIMSVNREILRNSEVRCS